MDLKKFNQLVLALILCLVLLGLGSIGYLIIKEEFFDSRRQAPPVVVGEASQSTPGFEPSLVFCLPTLEPETGTKFVGVAVINQAQSDDGAGFGKSDRSFSPKCKIGDRWSSTASIQNVVVISQDAQSQRLLFPRPVMVVRLVKPCEDEGKETLAPPDRLYWEIRERDSNGDGVIDEDDALSAYLSALDGSQLTLITPPESNLVAAKREPAAEALLMQVQYDTDQDGDFGPRDDTELLRYSFTSGAADPLLEADVIKAAQDLLIP